MLANRMGILIIETTNELQYDCQAKMFIILMISMDTFNFEMYIYIQNYVVISSLLKMTLNIFANIIK